MAELFRDEFTASNGTTLASRGYSVDATDSSATIQSNQARLQSTANGSWMAITRDEGESDGGILLDAYAESGSGNKWLAVMFRDGYALGFDIGSRTATLYRADTWATLATVSNFLPANPESTPFTLRVEFQGTAIRARAWDTGGSEGSGWPLNITNSVFDDSPYGLFLEGFASGTRSWFVDNLSYYDFTLPTEFTGSIAATEAPDTSSISGDVEGPPPPEFTGSIAATEAADTSSVSGDVEGPPPPPEFTGSIAATEAADTSSISGDVEGPPPPPELTGSIAATESPDTSAISGEVGAPVSPPEPEGTLVMADDFPQDDGDPPDSAKWNRSGALVYGNSMRIGLASWALAVGSTVSYELLFGGVAAYESGPSGTQVRKWNGSPLTLTTIGVTDDEVWFRTALNVIPGVHAGDPFWVRIQARETSPGVWVHRGKLWLKGTPEPVAWTFTLSVSPLEPNRMIFVAPTGISEDEYFYVDRFRLSTFDTPSIVEGTIAATEGADTSSISGETSGAPTLTGSIHSVEQGDVGALTGSTVSPPALEGAVAATEAPDTAALAGEVATPPALSGEVAATEGRDTSSIVGGGILTDWSLAFGVGITADEYAAASDTVLSSELQDDGEWRVISAGFDGSDSSVRVDDEAPETGDTGKVEPSVLRVGGRAFTESADGEHWVGEIAEVIVFGGKLSPEEIDAIHQYLATKYGL